MQATDPSRYLYFSQLMGLALGLDVSDYGWEQHYIDVQPLLSDRGLWPVSSEAERA